MKPEECRQSRELLAWTRIDLAREAACSSETIKNFEERWRATVISIVTALQRVLKNAGVEFMTKTGGRVRAR